MSTRSRKHLNLGGKMDFHQISLKELITQALGEEAAHEYISEIQEGFNNGLRGPDLMEHAQKAMGKVPEPDETP